MMRRQLRDYDVCGRFGGEEFTILFPHTDAAAAAHVAERLRAMAAGLSVGRARITVSVGVTSALPPGADLDEMLAAADAALYHAKANGRNQVCAPHAHQLPLQFSPAHLP
jgi:diguanylate cyclase (GGDEF)-like protein